MRDGIIEEAGPFLGPHPPKKDVIPGEGFRVGERGATEDIVSPGDITHPMVHHGAERIEGR